MRRRTLEAIEARICEWLILSFSASLPVGLFYRPILNAYGDAIEFLVLNMWLVALAGCLLFGFLMLALMPFNKLCIYEDSLDVLNYLHDKLAVGLSVSLLLGCAGLAILFVGWIFN